MTESGTRSGFVSVVGRANVGKSTLVNLFVGEKITIVSPKPQTTRNTIRGVLTRGGAQAVFLDTPGLHRPRTKLGGYMVKCAVSALFESDVVLFMTEPRLRAPEEDANIIEKLRKTEAAVFLVINKVDTVAKPDLLKIIENYIKLRPFDEIFPVSALKADNTGALLDAIFKRLPDGPMYFPEDSVTDMPERTLAAEIIREKALSFLQEEIPHGIAVEILLMRGREGAGDGIVDIEASIYCEKDSHKPIIIGRGGETLKKIGAAARRDIEALLGSRIYLQLWVKVKKNWRDNDLLLKNFGYDPKEA